MQKKDISRGLLGLSMICAAGGIAFGRSPQTHATAALLAISAIQALDAATLKAQHEIEKVILVRDVAFDKKDVEGALRTYASDYHYQTDTGPETKVDFRKNTIGIFGMAHTIHSTTTVEDVHLSDGGKTATIIEKAHVILTTAATKAEKAHKMELYSTSRSVWVKSSGGTTWLEQTRTNVSRTATMDGVPQNLPTPAPAAAPAQPAATAPVAPGA